MSMKSNTYHSRLEFHAGSYVNQQLTAIPRHCKALKMSIGDLAIENVTSDAYDKNIVGISNVD